MPFYKFTGIQVFRNSYEGKHKIDNAIGSQAGAYFPVSKISISIADFLIHNMSILLHHPASITAPFNTSHHDDSFNSVGCYECPLFQ